MDITPVLKAMEDAWNEQEEAFEFTRILYDLELTCPLHHVGQKNLKRLCHTCPICKIDLGKTLKQ